MKGKKRGLGQLLIEERIVEPHELTLAMDYKKEHGVKLGQALIELKLLDELKLAKILSMQLNIPFKRKDEIIVDKVVLGKIPIDMVKAHHSFPFDINDEEKTISFLTIDPLNLVLEDTVFHETEYRVKFYLGLSKDIDSLIYEHYENEKVMQDLEGMGISDKDDDFFDVDIKDNNSPIVKIVNNIFKIATQEKASDIHIAPTESKVEIRYRIDGILHKSQELTKKAHAPLVSRIKMMADMDITEKRKPQDGRIQISLGGRNIDMRLNTLPTIYGEKITARLLDKESVLLNLEDLGFQPRILEEFKQIIHQPVGIVLLTGPTGSGKTSTLYTAINALNDVSRNIVTIEDPVEYKLQGIVQSQVNEKAGYNFANGLRAILRQDPDIVLIGEIRDLETAKIAVNAANTGHLVLATLHTNDSISTVSRLVDMGIEPYMIASTLTGVVNQRLVRAICEECKVSYESTEDSPERAFFEIDPDKPLTLYKGEGCDVCKQTGYKGRLAIQELLTMKNTLRRMIAKEEDEGELLAEAIKNGLVPMKQDGLEKALLGKTTLEEVKRFIIAT